MNLLLDSHAFLWFVSLWELTIKVSIGKLSLADPVAPFLVRELASNKFSTLDITIDHLAALSNLPFHHRDPFDRMIVSQAIADSISIVSTDVALDAYGVSRIW